MNKDDLEVFKLSNFKFKSEYVVESFIISNNVKDPFENHLSFGYPFLYDGIAFIICIEGETNIKVNFKEYILSQNSILTILPRSILEPLKASENLHAEILVFNEEFISDMPLPKDLEILKEISINPVLKIEDQELKNLLNYHAFIIETFNRRKGSTFLSGQIKGLLYSLVMELATIYKGTSIPIRNKGRYEELTEGFIKLLYNHFRTERTAVFYADRLFITPKHLSHVLKEVTGKTVNAWIDEAIIIGAKSLLKSTNYTVLQISEDLNFPTASYFGRYFKRHTGMTPLEYREK